MIAPRVTMPVAIKLVCSKCGYVCPAGRGNDKDFFKLANTDGKVECVWCKYYSKTGSLIRKTAEEYLNAYRASFGLPPVKLGKKKKK